MRWQVASLQGKVGKSGERLTSGIAAQDGKFKIKIGTTTTNKRARSPIFKKKDCRMCLSSHSGSDNREENKEKKRERRRQRMRLEMRQATKAPYDMT